MKAREGQGEIKTEALVLIFTFKEKKRTGYILEFMHVSYLVFD